MKIEKKIKVAVIDSGFREIYRELKNPIIERIHIMENGQNGDVTDENGHGTGLISIIDRLCDGVEFIIIKILNKHCSCTSQQLIRAMEIALVKNVDIVNVSLGTTDMKLQEQFQTICDKARSQNIMIITTCEQNNQLCVPFFCNGTIKVLSQKNIMDNEICYKDNIFYARGMDHLIPWSKDTYIYSGSNSFSTPYIIEKLVKLRQAGILDWEKLFFHLIKQSKELEESEYICVSKLCYTNQELYEYVKKIVEDVLQKELDNRRLSLHGMSIEASISIMEKLFQILDFQVYYEDFNYIDFEYVENITNKIEKMNNSRWTSNSKKGERNGSNKNS